MGSNPRQSQWYSTAQAKRKRPVVYCTMSPEAIERLNALAKKYGSRGAAVEALIEFYDTVEAKKKASNR